MSRFEEVSPKKSRELLENLLKQLFSDLPTASLVIYISSYPACPQRITVNYNNDNNIDNNRNFMSLNTVVNLCIGN